MCIHTAAVHNSSRLDPTRIMNYCTHTYTQHTQQQQCMMLVGSTHTHTHTQQQFTIQVGRAAVAALASRCVHVCFLF